MRRSLITRLISNHRFLEFNSIRTISIDHLVHVKGDKTIHVEEDNEQKMFACIHLEPTFPYEHTKPLPKEEELKMSDSVLKHEIQKKDIYSSDPSLSEVQKLTYTSEHFWKKDYSFKKSYRKKELKQRDGI